MNRAQIRTAIKELLDDLVGTDSEQYWSKSVLNIYIQEAMDEIAKRTLCIKDSLTPAFCSIDMVADTIHYPIPDGVLRIDKVIPSWNGRPLEKTDHEEIMATNPLWEDSTSEPRKYLTDFTTGYISLVGSLTAVTTEKLKLTVRRLPTVIASDTAVIDIPSQFHNMSYEWVLYRCFSKQDSEVYSKTMANDFLLKFEGPTSQLGKGGNIQQIILQINEFCTKPKSRFF